MNLKTTPQRPSAGTPQAALQAADNATRGPIAPPHFVAVRDEDRPLWDAIVTARPRDTWTTADLILAGQLARLYADVAELEDYLDEHGLMAGGEPNPACNLLDKTSRRALAVARQLKIDTVSTVGKAHDIHSSAELERNAREGLDDDDGLIPRAH